MYTQPSVITMEVHSSRAHRPVHKPCVVALERWHMGKYKKWDFLLGVVNHVTFAFPFNTLSANEKSPVIFNPFDEDSRRVRQ